MSERIQPTPEVKRPQRPDNTIPPWLHALAPARGGKIEESTTGVNITTNMLPKWRQWDPDSSIEH